MTQKNKTQKAVVLDEQEKNRIKQILACGKGLFAIEEYNAAKDCFEKVYKAVPDSVTAQAWLFLGSLFVDDDKRAFELFGLLYEDAPELKRRKLRYYLFLMDEIFGYVPMEYGHIFREAQIIENVTIPYDLDGRNKTVTDNINKIRERVIMRSYPYAIELLNLVKDGRSKPKTEDILETRLLKRAAAKSNERRHSFSKYIKNNDFDEFVHLLSDRIANHSASLQEEYLFKLYNHYESIRKGIVPEIEEGNSKDSFEAIDNNDFLCAIKYNIEHSKMRNYLNAFDSPMYLFLNKIIIEIVKLSMVNGAVGTETYDLIDRYLEAIEKTEYKAIIRQLIVIGIQKKNMDDVIDALNKISFGEYKLNVDYFVSTFELAIHNKDVISARACMNALKTSSTSEQNNDAEGLADILSTLEQANPDRTAFANMYEELLEKRGAILFDLSQVEDKNGFIAEAKKHDDVKMSLVNGENQVLAKYQAQPLAKSRLGKLEKRTRDASIIKHYKTCIENGMQFVEHSKSVDPYIYNCLGKAYFGIKKYDLAINFLRIYLSHSNIPMNLRQNANFLISWMESNMNADASKTIEITGEEPTPATLGKNPMYPLN